MASDPADFQHLGITVKPAEKAQFFYGDNVEGYFEGRAGVTGGGSGYWLNGSPLLRDIFPMYGKKKYLHEQAKRAIILPHAIRHEHANLAAEVSILHRQRAAAIRISGGKSGSLGAGFLFDPGAGEITARSAGGTISLKFKNTQLHAAVASAHGVKMSGVAAANGLQGVIVELARSAKSADLYIAFAETASDAAHKAKALVENNGLNEHRTAIGHIIARSWIETGDEDYDRAVAWAKLTSYFLVTEEFGKGIWAGLPWFKNNWGRDTFIALPGTLLVSGMFDDARDVILNFLRYQDKNPVSPTYGRVPNRVQSATDIIYNTADGTPWLIRELYEYLQYTGDLKLALKVYPQIKLAIDGAIKKFVDREGFLTHDDADTWMDARIMGDLPWSARGNRANDIQALWHNALLIGVRLASYAKDKSSGRRWEKLAAKVKRNFRRRFWNQKRAVLADRITADNRRDEKVRPNQLMVISIPMIESLLDEKQSARVVENAVGELLYPYGIASLSQRDPYFHPHHHRDEWHHFDAAYHNGTVWGWNAGFTVTAMCRTGHTQLAYRLAQNLTDQILNLGCRGSMSELIEAIPRKRGELTLSGTWAQAWSTSEFARNAYQDFGGFHPRLLDGQIHLNPHIPKNWRDFSAEFPFGKGASLRVNFTRWKNQSAMHIEMAGIDRELELVFSGELDGYVFNGRAKIAAGRPVVIQFSRGHAVINSKQTINGKAGGRRKKLMFVQPGKAAKARALRKKNFLQSIIEAGQFR